MESKARILGHPIHPILIVFPLGLLATAVIFDVVALVSAVPKWAEFATYLTAAGVVGGLLAAVPGTIDWLAIPNGTRAKRVGLLHGVGNVIVVALFLVDWLLRRETPAAPPTGSVAAGLIGLGLALVTGWLGGELVGRLGVGVDDGANLNAPSSLSGRFGAGHALERARAAPLRPAGLRWSGAAGARCLRGKAHGESDSPRPAPGRCCRRSCRNLRSPGPPGRKRPVGPRHPSSDSPGSGRVHGGAG